MIRKNWEDIYAFQDIALKRLSSVPNIFLAGGTAIQRFVIAREQRESDDLDFFLPHYFQSDAYTIVRNIKEALIFKIDDEPIIKIENYVNNNDGVYRFFCSMQGNSELLKIELLDCTANRYGELSFIQNAYFHSIENAYNLILYKLKALCDRQDTIKDLFDLYFLLREHEDEIDQRQLFIDLQTKFQETTNYIYDESTVVVALEANHRKWDIIVRKNSEISLVYIKEAIEEFRKDMLEAITNPQIKTFALSYEQRAKYKFPSNITTKEYYQYVETNLFIENEYFWWAKASFMV